MFRIPGHVLAFGIAIAVLHPAGARAAAEESLAIVTGLAPGDLLNVRDAASPAGHVKTRLGNGASIRNFGCSDFNGYQWCRIEVADQGIDGWVPSRYLLAVDAAGTATPLQQGDAGGSRDAAATAEPLPDLAARFGDASATVGGAPAGEKQAALPGLTAEGIEAYRKDFQTQAKAMAESSRKAPGDAAPVPPQVAALADPASPAAAWDATGEIPCARYVGQPMGRCQVGVKRSGAGKADVTVTWPDGGSRIIGFFDGKPAGTDSGDRFRFTREGGLNMIRIGVSERFEITDALAFGD
jgi:hypothetical protein